MAIGVTRRQLIFGGFASLLLGGCGQSETHWGWMIKNAKARDAIRSNKILSDIMEGKRGPIFRFDIAPFNEDTEKAVNTVQEGLKVLGYRVDADGYYGKKTARALKDLQIKNSIPIDWANGRDGSKLGQRTLEALCRELGKNDPIL